MTDPSAGETAEPTCTFTPEQIDVDVPAPLVPDESCGRPVWEDADTERCVWHAEKQDKPVSRLAATVADGTLIGGYAPGTTLREVEFPAEATLLGATLAGADLRRTSLSNADLRGADLSGTDLIEADLAGAFLRHADLSGATLSNADLTDADLADTNLSEAALSGAALRKAGLRAADLSAADLSDAYLTGASLREADLSEAHLGAADATEATLTEAALTGATLEKAALIKADLSEADLSGADCEDARFDEAVLVRATLAGADLVGATLTEAHLFGADVDGARISSQTQLIEAGPIGDLSAPDRCRYDVDAAPDGPEASLVMDADDLAAADDPPRVIQLRRARSVYRRLEELARQNGFPALQSTMFTRRQEMRRRLLRTQGRRAAWLFAEAQRWVFVYGESFRRVLTVSGLIVLGFWLLFMTTGTVATPEGTVVTPTAVLAAPVLAWETLYHSVLLFFTGSQVLAPTSVPGQMLVTVEASTGPILLALLVFVLGRRAAR